jgi:hypothetical protein
MLTTLLLALRIAAAPTDTGTAAAAVPPMTDSIGAGVAADSLPALDSGPRLGRSPFTMRAGPLVSTTDTGASPSPADTVRPHRPRAVEYSDWYARRLAVHRVASYTMLPLFVAEYALGQRLMSTSPQPTWIRPTHIGVAYATAALFGVNTLTGAWNLWDARHDESGRTRRVVHTALMLASEAGFAYTGSIANQARTSLDGANRHRNAAIASMGLSVVGSGMMVFWKD